MTDASALVEAVHELGHQIRAGAHTGEVERRDTDDIAGLAVPVRRGAHNAGV